MRRKQQAKVSQQKKNENENTYTPRAPQQPNDVDAGAQ